MKIFVNESEQIVQSPISAFTVRDRFKPGADVIILNGFTINTDTALKDGDYLSLIRRGESPSESEIENLLVARHTPGVHAKIKNACVGIAGLGGLGSTAVLSLARIGIGTLIIADFDVVEPSNLNRQQYFVRQIGMKKTEAMKEIINSVNPFVKIIARDIFLDEKNITECFGEADIIVEAFDNPASKAMLVNAVLTRMKDKKIVAASGMAGYASGNLILAKRMNSNFYLIGDNESEAKPGSGLMAPRVGIAANQQANMVLRLLLGEDEV